MCCPLRKEKIPGEHTGVGSAASLAGAQAYMADLTEGRDDRASLLGMQQAAVAIASHAAFVFLEIQQARAREREREGV